MNSLKKLETNIRRCVQEIEYLRLENERIRQNAEEVTREVSSFRERSDSRDDVKKAIIGKLESLAVRIDTLQIDSITND
jgi:FtsZ-binding cell division protein ZapB